MHRCILIVGCLLKSKPTMVSRCDLQIISVLMPGISLVRFILLFLVVDNYWVICGRCLLYEWRRPCFADEMSRCVLARDPFSDGYVCARHLARQKTPRGRCTPMARLVVHISSRVGFKKFYLPRDLKSF